MARKHFVPPVFRTPDGSTTSALAPGVLMTKDGKETITVTSIDDNVKVLDVWITPAEEDEEAS